MIPLDVRTLPAEALLGADFRHPEIIRATGLFEQALAGKTVLPLATGGTTAHVLAIDYALRPVLSSMVPRTSSRAGSRSTRTSPWVTTAR